MHLFWSHDFCLCYQRSVISILQQLEVFYITFLRVQNSITMRIYPIEVEFQGRNNVNNVINSQAGAKSS